MHVLITHAITALVAFSTGWISCWIYRFKLERKFTAMQVKASS